MKTYDSLGRKKCVSWRWPLVHPCSNQPVSPPPLLAPREASYLGFHAKNDPVVLPCYTVILITLMA
eukprot:8871305-Ditylum_brightwellii.AAC.1